MNLISALRISASRFRRSTAKQRYWSSYNIFKRLACLLKSPNRDFAKHIARDFWNYAIRGNHPINGQTRERAQAALKWLYLAQDVTPDDGAAYGYFPCTSQTTQGWLPSYPETTGYIIQTLLDYANQYEEEEPRQRAMRMALWETEIQMPSGAVQGGPVCPPENQVAAVFNTGMVLQGYTAALKHQHDRRIFTAAQHAADFLLSDLRDDGHFQTHGSFVKQGKIKTYNCLCAWALYRFGEYVGDKKYQTAAVRAVEAAIGEQRNNGWFENSCITYADVPLLHTICYTLQGILEVGILTNDARFVAAAQKGTDPILEQISPNGFLYGRYFSDWKPADLTACLTGNAQLAVICYRLFQVTDNDKYRQSADLLVNFLKGLQVMNSPTPALVGALSGSFPILGKYMTAGYPNWATKYFLDSLLLQDQLSNT